MRNAKRRGSMLSDDAVIAVDKSASSMFAYLRHGFFFASFGEHDEERIMAARYDLLATLVLLAAVTGVIWLIFWLFGTCQRDCG